MRLFDMHCHLDFAKDPLRAAHELAQQDVAAFSSTVVPKDFEYTAQALRSCDNVAVGLGFHPWWIADNNNDDSRELFERLATSTRFIGEVGLDFSLRSNASHAEQMRVFEWVIRACLDGGKVVSLHAVKAVSEVLDTLVHFACLKNNACVFHWFSGTSDDLNRAVREGAFFSINPRMLESKRGRAYVQALPLERLLLETDSPALEDELFSAVAQRATLERLIERIAEVRAMPSDELAQAIADTSARLLMLE